ISTLTEPVSGFISTRAIANLVPEPGACSLNLTVHLPARRCPSPSPSRIHWRGSAAAATQPQPLRIEHVSKGAQTMSIEINWGDSSRSTIHLTFRRGWTWDHLRQAIQQADQMIGSVDHTVHLIIDLRNGGGVPGDFLSVAGDIFAQGVARANEGQRVVVGRSEEHTSELQSRENLVCRLLLE